MKTLLTCLLAAWAVAQATAAELEWMTDLPKAQEKAKADKKLVMLDFTGSDWCG
jgi:protein disulfide-isomerase